MQTSKSKEQLRREMLALRLKLSAERQQEARNNFAVQLRHLDLPPSVGAYVAVRGEVNILSSLLEAGISLALPRIEEETLGFVHWDRSQELLTGAFGIPAPAGPTIGVPSLIFVPCIAGTMDGWRLGYGGGFYDRLLDAHPHIITIGILHRECVLEGFPQEPQDRRLSSMFLV